MAEQVAKAVQAKMEQIEQGRKVLAVPNCIKGDQPGFDRQLFFDLSVKRQKITVSGEDWNLAIAGGVARNGVFQDRDVQPVVVLKRGEVNDDEVVNALVEFVDHSLLETLRQGLQAFPRR